jgi:hypothetical protein
VENRIKKKRWKAKERRQYEVKKPRNSLHDPLDLMHKDHSDDDISDFHLH